jgi:hypothetical protein
MSVTASASHSCIPTSVRRAFSSANGTHGRHGDILCDTAAYRNGGTTRTSHLLSNFGGNNHKRTQPHLVTIDYRNVDVCYEPEDFPPVEEPPVWPESTRVNMEGVRRRTFVRTLGHAMKTSDLGANGCRRK